MELTLFRRRLALGAALLRLFFVTRAAGRPAEPVLAPDGTPLTSPDQRPTTYSSVFGKVRFVRPYFTAREHQGICPLDAALSLPARCYSDLLREWAAYGATDASYRESQTVLERILGLSLSLQALDTSGVEAGGMRAAFYELPVEPPQHRPPTPSWWSRPLAQGVPMVQPPIMPPPVRLGKGQKRTKKKEAVVTALYTIAPYPRTPQEVVAALLDGEHPTAAARPVPVGKELRATLEGKTVAMVPRGPRVAQREGPRIQPRGALPDGAAALQQPLRPAPTSRRSPWSWTSFMRIEYLWAAAHARLGRPSPSAWRGYAPLWRRCWRARPTPSSRRSRPQRRTPPVLCRNGRRGSGRWATTDGIGHTCPTTISGARRADRNRRGGRGLWALGERPHGAVGDALDHRGRTGSARPAGGAAQRALGCVLAVASAPATSAVIRHVCPRTGHAGSPGPHVGGVINRYPPILVGLKSNQLRAARFSWRFFRMRHTS